MFSLVAPSSCADDPVLFFSLFILSNETVNIWSHLFGFFLFFSLGLYDMVAVLPMVGASREDYVIYSIGLFCFQVCNQHIQFSLIMNVVIILYRIQASQNFY